MNLLKEVGFDVFGVTSPWRFGIEVENEYAASISKAVFDVSGRKEAWFFLRSLRDVANARPWVELEEDGRVLVSIPSTTYDVTWLCKDATDITDEYISEQADKLISADGKSGKIIQVLNTNGFPILIAHWQSLYSNGLETGIRIIKECANRINTHLSDKVEWKSFEEIMNMVIADKENYKKPIFE